MIAARSASLGERQPLPSAASNPSPSPPGGESSGRREGGVMGGLELSSLSSATSRDACLCSRQNSVSVEAKCRSRSTCCPAGRRRRRRSSGTFAAHLDAAADLVVQREETRRGQDGLQRVARHVAQREAAVPRAGQAEQLRRVGREVPLAIDVDDRERPALLRPRRRRRSGARSRPTRALELAHRQRRVGRQRQVEEARTGSGGTAPRTWWPSSDEVVFGPSISSTLNATDVMPCSR